MKITFYMQGGSKQTIANIDPEEGKSIVDNVKSDDYKYVTVTVSRRSIGGQDLDPKEVSIRTAAVVLIEVQE